MRLIKTAIKNYLTVFVGIAIITYLGLQSYVAMPRETFPDIKVPYVFVNTFYFGVSPRDIESLVTDQIEKKLKNLKGLEKIQGISRESVSSIFLEFSPDVAVEDALQKVKDKVDMAKADLPKDAQTPVVSEFSFENFPFIYINLYGPLDLVRLKSIADDMKDQLEKVDGVLEVEIIGGQKREIQIIVDPARLQEKNLSYTDIQKAIAAENINIPGGNIDMGKAKYTVRVPGEFTDVSEIQNIIIKTKNGTPIYLKDVAVVQDAFQDVESYSRFNEKPSIALGLKKRSGTNLLRLADDVKKEAKDFVSKQNISGLQYSFVGDQSVDIRNMVLDLENHVFTGFFLVMLILFIFLGFRNALIVSSAIPLSMLLSFTILHSLGYTLNMIVLFSLVLVLGLLADDAIVVIENIYRYLEQGVPRKKACYKGAKEVFIPVLTSTLTTIAAFFPLLFWPGVMGKFMGYMPITVITTLTASLFVAMYVNPVMGSRLMGISRKHKGDMSEQGVRKQSKFIDWYEKMLKTALKHSVLSIALVVALFFVTFMFYGKLGKGVIFFPDTTPTQGYVSVKLPGSSVLGETEKIVSRIEKTLYAYDDLKDFSANIGGQVGGFSSGKTNPNQGQIVLDFKRRSVDKVGKDFEPRETLKKIRESLKTIPGAEIEITKPSAGPNRGSPVSVKISGENFDKLIEMSNDVKNKVKSIPGLINVKSDYDEGPSEISVRLDRDKMALIGLNTASVAGAIRSAIYGTKVSTFRDKFKGEEYDITVRYPESSRQTIEDIENIFVTSTKGDIVPLKVFSTIEFSKGVGLIQHKDFERVIEVTAEVEKGFNAAVLRGVVQKLIEKEVKLDVGYKISYTGEAQEQSKASSFLANAFLITIFLIFLILIAQFHSFLIPFIILGTIVMSLIGVLWGLIITQTPFCIVMTGVGVISLAGVVVKNGILLLDFTVHLRSKGLSRYDALVEAGKIRVRPVLLTASTAILGLLPMSTGVGFDFHKFQIVIGSDSSEWWASMSNAVIFGLAVATLLTLVVVPCLYNLLDGAKDNIAAKFKKDKAN